MFGTHNAEKVNFLTEDEVASLFHSAKGSRFGLRDYAMMLLAYQHGLRVSELIEAERSSLDLDRKQLWIERKLGGQNAAHVLTGDEIRALKAYLKTREDSLPWLFLSSQRTRMTRQNFSYLVARASERANMGRLHPNVLRDSCTHRIAAQCADRQVIGQWLGIREIRGRVIQKVIGPKNGK